MVSHKHPYPTNLFWVVTNYVCIYTWFILGLLKTLLREKTKPWKRLDDQSKSEILNHMVEFQGNCFQLSNLKYLMSGNFETFLENHVNQNVIDQSKGDEPFKMEDMRDGFLVVSLIDV